MERLVSVEIIKDICQCCLKTFPSLHSSKFSITPQHRIIFFELFKIKINDHEGSNLQHLCNNCHENITIIERFKKEILETRKCFEANVNENQETETIPEGYSSSEEYLAEEDNCGGTLNENLNLINEDSLENRQKHDLNRRKSDEKETKLTKLLAKYNVKFVENIGKPTKSPKVKCSLCAKVLTMNSFPVHLQQVHQGRIYNFMCEICSKKCVSNADLVVHRRRHTKEKPFRCDLCPSKFFNCKKNLIQHFRTIHFNQRRTNKILERCRICLKQFSQNYLVHFHMRKAHPSGIDDGVRVNVSTDHYHCKVCDGQYKTRRYFDNHVCISGAGDGPANQACLICGANLKNRFETIKHVQEVHALRLDETRWKCLVCETIVLDKIVLHIESVHTPRSSKCQFCGKELKNRRCLLNHIFVVHENGSEIRKLKRREKKGIK